MRQNAVLFGNGLTLPSRLLTTLKKNTSENIVGKGENAGNQHFHLFLQCFLSYQGEVSSFWLLLI